MPPKKMPARSGLFAFVLACAILYAIVRGVVAMSPDTTTNEVSYSAFKQLISTGRIQKVEIIGVEITATPSEVGTTGKPELIKTEAPAMGDDGLLPLLEQHSVDIVNRSPQDRSILLSLLPWVLIIGFWIFMVRRMQSMGGPGGMGGGQFKDFLKLRARKKGPSRETIRFADVAGQENAKREVSELIDFLKEPDRFSVVGAQVPRGILLLGPPGVGKTLLARALAGEADVPFFSTSASEFIEVFVGVGAARVRTMFEEAKQQAPAIIFIDELDSVGRTRGTGFGGGHDEREQTLNQILAEMDGFTGREAVIVLAATNRPDVLDPALLRPGRFDRHVELSLPTLEDRTAILKVHTQKTPLDSDVDLEKIAAGVPGFSGADIRNLVNEAAISAARLNAQTVSMAEFDSARDRIIMGTVRTFAIQPDERRRLAIHESGHTAVAYFEPAADPIYKVTIIPRGRSLGATHFLPEEERHTLPVEYLQAQLTVALAGRAAEKVLLGSVSSGADDDIQRATRLARAMVSRWGMSDEIGPIDLRASDDHPFLGRELASPRSYADATAAKVDAVVGALLQTAEARAVKIIEGARGKIEELATRLEAEESLDLAAIEACLAPNAPQLAKSRESLPSPPSGQN